MLKRKAKSCEGCRGLNYVSFMHRYFCYLGYEIDTRPVHYKDGTEVGGGHCTPFPKELCPKPRTYKDYVKTERKSGSTT